MKNKVPITEAIDLGAARVRRAVKKAANLFGVDLVRLQASPSHTFLGLRERPIRTVIDVGANTGQFARLALENFPEATVYSFEPLPSAFAELSAFAETHRARITPIGKALGEESGTVSMFEHTEHSPSSSLLKATEFNDRLYPQTRKRRSISVELSTLDVELKSHMSKMRDEVLIKMDVQGFEDRVIRGGLQTFQHATVCITEVSLMQLYDRQATHKDLTVLLGDLGFQYAGNLSQTYDKSGACVFVDAVYIKKGLEP